MGEGYLQEQNDSETAVSPSTRDSSQRLELGAHCTACRQLVMLESNLSRWLSWSVFLPGSLSELPFWGSSACFSAVLTFMCLGRGRNLITLISFRDFLKSISCLLSGFKGFPTGGSFLPRWRFYLAGELPHSRDACHQFLLTVASPHMFPLHPSFLSLLFRKS